MLEYYYNDDFGKLLINSYKKYMANSNTNQNDNRNNQNQNKNTGGDSQNQKSSYKMSDKKMMEEDTNTA